MRSFKEMHTMNRRRPYASVELARRAAVIASTHAECGAITMSSTLVPLWSRALEAVAQIAIDDRARAARIASARESRDRLIARLAPSMTFHA